MGLLWQPCERSAPLQHVAEHGGGQGPGRHVALAGVESADQVHPPVTADVGEEDFGAVTEGRAGARQLPA